MSWTSEPGVLHVVTNLLQLRLRAERLSLLQKVQFAEAQAKAAGLPTQDFQTIRQALLQHPAGVAESTFTVPKVPVRQFSTGPQNVAVMPRKGSKF